MSQPKSAVSALQEFCAKNKINPPCYDVIEDDELGFVCKVSVEAMDLDAIGNGRSKRDAKHFAALNALKRLCTEAPNSSIDLSQVVIPEFDDLIARQSVGGKSLPPLPPVDTVKMLRDYCVQNDHPLPKFECISQHGTPNAPRFTMLCQIASIQRQRTADSKKTAKQLAAFQMFLVIKDPTTSLGDDMELVSLKSKGEAIEEERIQLFKTYHELTESKQKPEDFGTPLFQRHNTLKKFHDHLKQEAFNILETEYESSKAKVYEVLRALKLRPKVEEVPSVKGHPMVYMELDCPGLDVCFCGFEETLYDEINNYFRYMLK